MPFHLPDMSTRTDRQVAATPPSQTVSAAPSPLDLSRDEGVAGTSCDEASQLPA